MMMIIIIFVFFFLFGQVIKKNLNKLILYYGTIDNWCPVSYYKDMKKRFPDGEIYLCQKKFDRAFVLESSHEVAEMVSSWIQDVITYMYQPQLNSIRVSILQYHTFELR